MIWRPSATSRRRSCETYCWTIFGALDGGSSPHSPSTRRSKDTVVFALSASIESTARCLGPASLTREPSSSTSTEPSMRICMVVVSTATLLPLRRLLPDFYRSCGRSYPSVQPPAEREGFEPSDEVNPRHTISNRARSAAPAPLLETARRVTRQESGEESTSALGVAGFFAGLLDLPGAAVQQGNAIAVPRDARDLQLVGADHEVDVDLALVDVGLARAGQEREALPERDVARGVLVEQRVVEDGAELADAALAVDERDLAEASGALVAGDDRAHHVLRRVGDDADGPAALEAHAQVAHDRAVDQHERLGGGHVPVRPVRIRGGEDLLRGQVGHVLDAVDRLEAGRLPLRAREQPDREVGARPLVVEGVEAPLGQAPRGGDERVGARPPRRDRVVLVKAQDVDD